MHRHDGAKESATARLLSDPPLLDRLTWREGIRPETLISRDRGLIARTFGSLYLIGAVVGLLIIVFAEGENRDTAALAAITVSALVLGAVCFVVYRHLPATFFQGMLVLGTLLITGAAAAAAPGSEAVYGFFYVWVVFAAFLFFPRRSATLQALFAALAYAVVLAAEDSPFAATLVLSAVATLGATAAIIGILMNRLETVAVGLATDAHTDPVTAIGNRRDFDQRIALELDRAERHGRPLSLVICDLDRFKAVNDALGHEEGDVALRRAAAAIGAAVRTVDAVARLGGEEFGVILPETSLEPATRIAERIRASVSDEFRSYAFKLTASCGVACTDDVDGGRDALFRAADGALYLAKREGRNRVIAHPVDEPRPEAAAAWSGAE